jgi:Mg-chelatase subunit ChlD
MEEERSAVERELELVRVSREEAVRAAVASDELIRLVTAPPPPLPWWRKALEAVKSFLILVLKLITWPIRALLRALGIVKPKERAVKGRPIVLPGGVAVQGLGDALKSNPHLRSALRSRAKALPAKERARSLWNRMLGREDYEDFAMKLMEREIAERTRAPVSASREREESFARRLGEIMEAEERRAREREEALARLEKEREDEMKRIEASLKESPERVLEKAILDELAESGLIAREGNEFLPTTRLLERFAQIVFAEEAKRIERGTSRDTGAVLDGSGQVTKEPMRSAYEIGHLDVVGTLVKARTRHPKVRHIFEDDVLIHREEREATNHVVIIFDRSGSMEENDRMKAAKRAVLALYRAVKEDDPSHQVDIVAMDTSVERVDLMGVWKSEPRGFTNTGAALRTAYDILRFSRRERGIVYLVTDGLPEAYTKNGVDVASQPEKCLAYAIEQARLLKNRPGVGVVQILLEPEDELYVKAADRIADEVGGRVLKASPKELAKTMLVEFQRRK